LETEGDTDGALDGICDRDYPELGDPDGALDTDGTDEGDELGTFEVEGAMDGMPLGESDTDVGISVGRQQFSSSLRGNPSLKQRSSQ